MKIMASILVIYVGLLMLQPFTGMCGAKKITKACTADMCCKEKSHNKGTTPCSSPSSCNVDLCNPFIPCGVSIIHREAKLSFANPVLDLLQNKKPTTNEDITSDYLSDCWRPPKLS